jgi:hypothetical protein
MDAPNGRRVKALTYRIFSMNWLQKLPGFQQTPYGFEWRLLRLMPTVCVAGTLLPLLMALMARYLITEGNVAELARRIQLFDFLMIGLVILILTLVLTLTIGCGIVWLMKGPAYVADGFEVSHSDAPKP